jgi:hypothetical protein
MKSSLLRGAGLNGKRRERFGFPFHNNYTTQDLK